MRQCVQGRLPGGGGSLPPGPAPAPVQLTVATCIQQHCRVLLFEGTRQAVNVAVNWTDQAVRVRTGTPTFLGAEAPLRRPRSWTLPGQDRGMESPTVKGGPRLGRPRVT